MALFDFGKKKEFEAPMAGMPPLPPLPPLPEEFGQQPMPFMPPMPQQQGMPPFPPAPQQVSQFQAQGVPPADIVRAMRQQGYPSTDILAGMQAQQFQPPMSAMPPIPIPPQPPSRPVVGPSKEDVVTLLTEDIQEIAETIIEEKWNKAKKDFADVEKWKDDVGGQLKGIEENVEATKQRMDSLEKAVFGKVEEYGKGIEDVSTELKAMQRVFTTIMPQFTSNVKELQALLEKNRKKKSDG